ncbi:hypothetical protein GC093_18080 [Paenibacillus sp. LMG 31456]|uniref:Uncharacterized protein n=1 Tax=Paenibacillus foliorum TaxID=2654974 RepID=A0A972GVT0_9BACL|nr:hypothetical protein [Paenibacillus foliorum]
MNPLPSLPSVCFTNSNGVQILQMLYA